MPTRWPANSDVDAMQLHKKKVLGISLTASTTAIIVFAIASGQRTVVRDTLPGSFVVEHIIVSQEGKAGYHAFGDSVDSASGQSLIDNWVTYNRKYTDWKWRFDRGGRTVDIGGVAMRLRGSRGETLWLFAYSDRVLCSTTREGIRHPWRYYERPLTEADTTFLQEFMRDDCYKGLYMDRDGDNLFSIEE